MGRRPICLFACPIPVSMWMYKSFNFHFTLNSFLCVDVSVIRTPLVIIVFVLVSLCLLVMIYLDLTSILALVFLGKTSLKHVFNLFETTTNDIIQVFCQILLLTFIFLFSLFSYKLAAAGLLQPYIILILD